jgi:phage I-like protein
MSRNAALNKTESATATTAGPLTLAMALPLPPVTGGAAPDWVRIFPKGKTDAIDGRVFELDDMAGVIARSLGPDQMLMVDYDHVTDLQPTGAINPAAGWITALDAREDGLYARIDWSDAGRAAVAGKAYRFVSPVFLNDKQGRVVQVLRLSLTNTPAMPMLTLATRQQPHTHTHTKDKDETMDFLEKLRAALKLADDADHALVLTTCSALVDTMAKVAAEVGADDAAGDALVKEVASLKAKGEAGARETAAIDTLQKEIASLRTERAQEKANTAVDKAVTEGKLTPAQKEWALSYCVRDPNGFSDFIDKQPVVLASGKVDALAGDPAAGSKTLDAVEKQVCAALGLSEEEFMKARDEEKQIAATRAGK